MPASNSAPAFRPGFPAPHWQAPGAALYLGDVRACLRALPSRSVHCVVCSPPYWGLRDYGTATWEGGDPTCAHRVHDARTAPPGSAKQASNNGAVDVRSGDCLCGARRIDAQIGLEESPDCLGWATGARCGECFVCHMVQVFAEVRRVLRDDGTLWLNLGDSYACSAKGNVGSDSFGDRPWETKGAYQKDAGVEKGNLVGVPWRTALALQADGWLLRNDVIWYSPNKMPESVENRCSKAHEHIFLFTKGSGYYFDHVAIQEPGAGGNLFNKPTGAYPGRGDGNSNGVNTPADWVNKRDVWVVSTQGYPGAHFAVYSPKLITPCILAGTSEHGACAECGAPYERVVVKVEGAPHRSNCGAQKGPAPGQSPSSSQRKDRDRSFGWSRNGQAGSGSTLDEPSMTTKQTVGWRRSCGCQTNEVVPCVVLDPFIGSGTTVATALLLGRYGVGIDLSEVYLRENAVPRIEAALRGEAAPRKPTVAVKDGAPPPFRKMRGV